MQHVFVTRWVRVPENAYDAATRSVLDVAGRELHQRRAEYMARCALREQAFARRTHRLP